MGEGRSVDLYRGEGGPHLTYRTSIDHFEYIGGFWTVGLNHQGCG